MSLRSLAPRMRQIPARKSAILSVLDVGASKIVCLIARLTPMEPSEALRGRTHRCKVLGIGHQRSNGVKGGAVVDLHAAEHAVRLAVDAAERMAGVEVGGVIINMSGGRLASRRHGADAKLRGKTVAEHDIHHVLEAAAAVNAEPGRTILHALPTAFRLDSTKDVRDPKGMVGHELGVDLHLATCDSAAARNLMLVIERCHLRVEAMVATPYAAGLSTLVDDEAELGAAVVDFGGGSTTVGVFSGGRLIHVDAVALGGIHVTTGRRARSQRFGQRRRTPEDPVRRLHRLALRRPRNHHRAPARRRPWIIQAICRSRSSCESSARGWRRSSNSCATGSRRQGTRPRPAADW